MKRIMMTALMICMLLSAARAEGRIPDAVLRRCEKSYPGYAVLTSDGYDDGKTGQWALVLHKDGDNVLVLAERTNGGEYMLTVSNPTAVPDEADGYSSEVHRISVKLSKHYKTQDRLGLFELVFEQPDVSRWVVSSELSEDGRTWGNVISDYTSFDWDGRNVWWSNIMEEDGTLSYMRHQEDEDGKPLKTVSYPRMPVGGESAAAHLLDCFDAGTYPYMPDLINGKTLGDYAREYVPDGYRLIQLDLQPDALILLVESPQGERTLRILPHENWQFQGAIVTGPLPGNASLDTFHSGEGEVQLTWFDGEDQIEIGFEQTALRIFRLVWMMTGEGILQFTHNSVALWEEMIPQHNDAVHYGDHPWQRIEEIDFAALPKTIKEAVAMMDQSGFAVVNNPRAEDRLHLRELPRKDARSLGKFYNRTPVLVHAIEGEWANVSIGSLTGWMMTKFLAFGEEMDGVACAFPQEFIREELNTLQLQPWKEGKTVGHIDRETAFYIIGVEEDRYIILTADGVTGYAPQSKFYPGNG